MTTSTSVRPADAASRATPASSGMGIVDLADESLAGLFARPGRTALTVCGTMIGLAALVATLGLSRTAGNRIVGRFDELAATEIVVSPKPAQVGQPGALPWDAPERLARLNGVRSAGNLSAVGIGTRLVSASPVSDPTGSDALKLGVVAASPGLFPAVRATVRTGATIDRGQSSRSDRVVVLGPNAAERLGATRVDQLPAVRIGDDLFLVIGILDDVARQPDLLSAVIIPEGTARRMYSLAHPGMVVIDTDIGAAKVLTRQVAAALRPDNIGAVKVASPPEPRRVRDGVQSDLDLLFVLLGAVSLLVGAIGIANVTLVSVIERTGEIGLRRALGASRRHIAQQFLLESATIGFLGGVMGASVGVLIVVAISALQTWTPVLDPAVALWTPILGASTGMLAGTYPSWRAAQLTPVDALRSGT